MKKLVLIAMLLLVGLTASHALTRSSYVIVYGKAANYLYDQYTTDDGSKLEFTRCVHVQRHPHPIECAIEANQVKRITNNSIRIYGLGAREIYDLNTGAPEKSGISCFVALLGRNRTRIGCDLKAKIISANGLE